MKEPTYESRDLDHLGILAAVIDKSGLVETIDRAIPASELRKITVGLAVKAMILNALGFTSRALYLTPEFFRNKPVELLFGPGVTPEDLNDDSLGRALDHLYRAGLTTLFAMVSAKALAVFGIVSRFCHLDSTTISLDGQYKAHEPEKTPITEASKAVSENPPPSGTTEEPDGEPVPIHLTYGHSKDSATGKGLSEIVQRHSQFVT